MRSLDQARDVCEAYLPGLIDGLDKIPFAEREASGAATLPVFRASRGPALVIPRDYGGLGASPLDAVRVARVVGAYAPSLAVATTMHHFSVATLFTFAESIQRSGMEWALLEAITGNNLLVASGFAEGRPDQGILSPTMTARRTEGGYLINGSKKPCSLSHSMDLLTASIALPNADGAPETAFLLIPSTLRGITRHPFWASSILAGAESDEIRLTDVLVEEELVVRTDSTPDGTLDDLQTTGFIWFELLISAGYLGMASALVERTLAGSRGSPSDRAALGARLETATLLLEGAARAMMAGETDNDALAAVLMARFGAQDAIGDATRRAVELLGGMAFIGANDVAYLSAATQCLAFHPPSRTSLSPSLVDYMDGSGPLTMADQRPADKPPQPPAAPLSSAAPNPAAAAPSAAQPSAAQAPAAPAPSAALNPAAAAPSAGQASGSSSATAAVTEFAPESAAAVPSAAAPAPSAAAPAPSAAAPAAKPAPPPGKTAAVPVKSGVASGQSAPAPRVAVPATAAGRPAPVRASVGRATAPVVGGDDAADWDLAPSLFDGAGTLRLTARECDLRYWFGNVPQKTLRGNVTGYAPEVSTPDFIRRPGPFYDALLAEVAFRALAEERAARALGYLMACAPDSTTMEFYATQLLDETRHAMIFRNHMTNLGVSEEDIPEVIERLAGEDRQSILQPIEEFGLPIVRDNDDFYGGVVLLTVLVEGFLAPSFELSERKWRPLDPVMADLEKGAAIDEVRHLAVGSSIIREHLESHPEEKRRLLDVVGRGMAMWTELPVYDQLRRWEVLFQEGMREHADVIGDYEIWPGRRLADTTPEERIQKAMELTGSVHSTRLMEMGLR